MASRRELLETSHDDVPRCGVGVGGRNRVTVDNDIPVNRVSIDRNAKTGIEGTRYLMT